MKDNLELFDIEDCTMITVHEFRCLCFNFPQWSSQKFGYVINDKGHKYYFIKDKFKEQLEQEGWL